MSITFVGTAYIRKYFDKNDWYTEEFGIYTSTNNPLYGGEEKDDFHITIAGYDWDDIPDEEGFYAVQYAATISWYTDYWGEVDADPDIHWSKVTKLSEKDEKEFFRQYEEARAESEKMFQFQ